MAKGMFSGISVFTLAIFNLPSISPARSSKTGPIMIQGPHHGAQKSTRTGNSDSRISFAKFCFVTSIVFDISILVKIYEFFIKPLKSVSIVFLFFASMDLRQVSRFSLRYSSMTLLSPALMAENCSVIFLQGPFVSINLERPSICPLTMFRR